MKIIKIQEKVQIKEFILFFAMSCFCTFTVHICPSDPDLDSYLSIQSQRKNLKNVYWTSGKRVFQKVMFTVYCNTVVSSCIWRSFPSLIYVTTISNFHTRDSRNVIFRQKLTCNIYSGKMHHAVIFILHLYIIFNAKT